MSLIFIFSDKKKVTFIHPDTERPNPRDNKLSLNTALFLTKPKIVWCGECWCALLLFFKAVRSPVSHLDSNVNGLHVCFWRRKKNNCDIQCKVWHCMDCVRCVPNNLSCIPTYTHSAYSFYDAL